MLLVKFYIGIVIISLLFICGELKPVFAQNPASSLGGIVVDQNSAVIPGVEVTILNQNGTLERKVLTDLEGVFSFPFLPPDEYTLKIYKEGFDPSEVPDLMLTENSNRQFKIELKITSIAETIKVYDEISLIDENKVNATIFDQKTIDDFPINGRNHQSLINLVPGVVLTPVNSTNLGQFSANGQRTNANYFTVDGVSANFGTTNYDFLGQTGSGSIPATNIQGGLDNLVSTEALQEVKVQTLDFAPSSGRMPGANVSFVSRSGGKDLSFSLFQNFRNAAFNAKDYFDIEKPKHNFNNFGGSFGGPLSFSKPENNQEKNLTYFFLSFEGKQFTLPQPTITTLVPSLEIRKETNNLVAQSIYNSFPVPNEKDDKAQSSAIAQQNPSISIASLTSYFPKTSAFRATYSDPNGSENYNLRLDHNLNSKISFFGRFNYSPSFSENRNPSNLSSFIHSEQITRTLTFGSTQVFSSNLVNEFRFNLSQQNGNTKHDFDGNYGGILPDKSIFIPESFNKSQTHFRFTLNGFPDSLNFLYGNFAQNKLRQINFADNLAYSTANHEIKFGIDYRQLSPTLRAAGFGIDYDFNSSEAVDSGIANRVSYYQNPSVNTEVLSFSSYIQDNWKLNPKFNLLFGVRWEINPSPTIREKENLLTFANAPILNQADQNDLKLAPTGTPYYKTRFNNFAPRFGFAWQFFDQRKIQIVFRGGLGTFYDLGQSQFNEISSPFEHANEYVENLILPINNYQFNLISGLSQTSGRLSVIAAASDYALPKTYLWNLTSQVKIGANHLFAVAYVGGKGTDLQRTLTLNLEKPNGANRGYFSNDFSKIVYIDNESASDYHAFQFQFTRNLFAGFKSFVNYTWSHSIDSGSSDSNISAPFVNYAASINRGNSDFDVRHSLNAGFAYQLPKIEKQSLIGNFLKNWSISGIFFARTGLPFDVNIAQLNPITNVYELRRADLAGNFPTYLETQKSPTGIQLNAAAFSRPKSNDEQGNLGRNALSGPSMWQLDTALSKNFKITERYKFAFQWQIYNIFNRPNFSNPQSTIRYQSEQKIVPNDFGVPVQTMARGFAASEATGGVNPIFQLGGARTMQFTVRLNF